MAKAVLPWYSNQQAHLHSLERVAPPPFYATAYKVYRKGVLVGHLLSQRSGRRTYWGYTLETDLDSVRHDSRPTCGNPSRPDTLDHLLTALDRTKKD